VGELPPRTQSAGNRNLDSKKILEKAKYPKGWPHQNPRGAPEPGKQGKTRNANGLPQVKLKKGKNRFLGGGPFWGKEGVMYGPALCLPRGWGMEKQGAAPRIWGGEPSKKKNAEKAH